MAVLTKICFFFTYLLFLVMYIFPLSSYVKENLSFKTVLSSSTIVQPIEKNQTEEKAKVVTAGWGKELIQFHAALEI